jgi:ElaB/YqjD/DUF883 family membrane-anchored ribosome-binding protein
MAEGSSSTDAGAEARGAIDDVMKRGKETAHSMAEAARDVLDSTRGQMHDAGAKAAANLKDGVEKQSASTADSLSHLADKLAEGRASLSDPWMASLVGQTETSLRSVSGYLAASKPDRYLSDLTDFARKNPAIALGGAVAIGFLLARAGKTAAHELAETDTTTPGASPQPNPAAWTSSPANTIPAE